MLQAQSAARHGAHPFGRFPSDISRELFTIKVGSIKRNWNDETFTRYMKGSTVKKIFGSTPKKGEEREKNSAPKPKPNSKFSIVYWEYANLHGPVNVNSTLCRDHKRGTCDACPPPSGPPGG